MIQLPRQNPHATIGRRNAEDNVRQESNGELLTKIVSLYFVSIFASEGSAWLRFSSYTSILGDI